MYSETAHGRSCLPKDRSLLPEKSSAHGWITLPAYLWAADAFFPFGDNIERARKSGVSYIAEPGGSVRDDNVIETCDKYGIVTVFTGQRLFHH